MDKEIKAFFLVPSSGAKSEILQNAFDALRRENAEPEWIEYDMCCTLQEKNDSIVYVVDPFEGKAFDHLCELGCFVLGPLAILLCLQSFHPLPRKPNPVYSVSFRSVVISFTSVDATSRGKYTEKVVKMGGTVSGDLRSCVTHVVAGQVGSKKYHVAGLKNIPILTLEWIDELWERGQYQLQHATLPEYLKAFKCPIFKGLEICVSQVSQEDRQKVEKIIIANGGRYSGSMKCKASTHLALLKPEGQKYKHAKLWNLHIVSVQWIYDSVKKGFSQDEQLYQLDASGDVTTLNNADVTSLSQTLNSSSAPSLPPFFTSAKSVDQLDVLAAEEAGSFLDGCNVLLCGFTGIMLDKLRRIVNIAGGTRYDRYQIGVTHIIVDKTSKNEGELKKMLSKAGFDQSSDNGTFVVDLQWIVQCIRLKECVSPVEYIVHALTPITIDDKMDGTVTSISAIMPNLSQAAANEPLVNENTLNKDDEPQLLFSGITFVIQDYSPEDESILGEELEKNGAKIDQSMATHCLVPLVYDKEELPSGTYTTYVTHVWTSTCIEREEVVSIDESPLFTPITAANGLKTKPFEGCVVSLSMFATPQRQGLAHIIRSLGGIVQENFVRKANKNLRASTHLVSAAPDGDKFRAAKMWKIPAVSAVWIIDIAKCGQMLPVTKYLVDSNQKNELNIEDEHNEQSKEFKRPSPVKERRSRKSFAEVVSVSANLTSTPTERRSARLSSAGISPFLPSQRVRELIAEGRQEDGPLNQSGGPKTPTVFDYPSIGGNVSSILRNITDDDISVSENAPPVSPSIGELCRRAGIEFMDKAGPLKDVICFLTDVFPPEEQEELRNLITSLHGHYCETNFQRCTHVIHRAKMFDLHPIHLKAQKIGKKIVSPRWLEACLEAGQRVNEDDHPYCEGFDAKKDSSDGDTRVKIAQKRQISDDTAEGEDSHLAKIEALQREHSAKKRKDSRSSVVTRRSQRTPEEAVSTTSNSNAASGVSTSKPNLLPMESEPQIDCVSWEYTKREELECLQSTAIDFGPTKPPQLDVSPLTMQQSTVRSRLNTGGNVPRFKLTDEDDLSSMDLPDDFASEPQHTVTTRTAEVQEKPKLFVLSSCSDKKAYYTDIIVKLGSVVDKNSYYVPESTHLIILQISKSEKFLAFIAAGKWILHGQYLEDSAKAGHFLPEEPYQWGKGRIPSTLAPQESKSDIVRTSVIWREKILSQPVDNCGAYVGWRCLLFTGAKQPAHRRLLEAGGATILEANDYNNATHAFFDDTNNRTKIADLSSRGIACYKVDCLFLYLMQPDNGLQGFQLSASLDMANSPDLSSNSSNISMRSRRNKRLEPQ